MFYQNMFGGLETARGGRTADLGEPGEIEGIDRNPGYGRDPLDPCTDMYLTPEQRRELGCDAQTFSGSTRGQTTERVVYGPRCHPIQLPAGSWATPGSEGQLRLRGTAGDARFENDCVDEGLTHAQVQRTCGDPPSICGGPTIPSAKEANEEAPVWFVGEDVGAEWTNLVQCAWTLLIRNIEVVDWVHCLVSADPRAGHCLSSRIRHGTVLFEFTDDMSGTDLEALPTWLAKPARFFVLPGGDPPWTVTFRYRRGYGSNLMTLWKGTKSEKACACLSLSEVLLHELSHSCWRDALDNQFDRQCAFNDILENSYAYAMMQRLTDAREAPQCCRYALDTNWFSAGVVRLNMDAGTGCWRT